MSTIKVKSHLRNGRVVKSHSRKGTKAYAVKKYYKDYDWDEGDKGPGKKWGKDQMSRLIGSINHEEGYMSGKAKYGKNIHRTPIAAMRSAISKKYKKLSH